MSVDKNKIIFLANKDPEQIPWSDHNVDIVLECNWSFY